MSDNSIEDDENHNHAIKEVNNDRLALKQSQSKGLSLKD